MLKKSIFPLAIIIVLFTSLFTSCGGCKSNKPDSDTTKVIPNVNIPDFNADSAYNNTARQVAFGPRVPNSLLTTNVPIILFHILKNISKDVIVQASVAKGFDGKALNFKNIIVSFFPRTTTAFLYQLIGIHAPLPTRTRIQKTIKHLYPPLTTVPAALAL